MRPRSNDLTGPNGPRRPDVKMEMKLKLALAGARPVADSLRTFLLKIFGDRSLMEDTSTEIWPTTPVQTDQGRVSDKPVPREQLSDTLADKIYDLYTGGGGGASSRDETQLRAFLVEVLALTRQFSSVLEKVQGQSYKKKLDEILGYSGKALKGLCNDFIYFFPRTSFGATCRVYANARFASIPKVLAAVLDYIDTTPDHGVANFKTVGPAMPKRADTIVIYCGSQDYANQVGEMLLKSPEHFEMPVPEMTTRLHLRTGISTGAEPIWAATGLGSHRGGEYEEPEFQEEFGVGSAGFAPQSFGSIRAEAIAAAILHFRENKALYGGSFESFLKFVSVAFVGFGLDPTRPGN